MRIGGPPGRGPRGSSWAFSAAWYVPEKSAQQGDDDLQGLLEPGDTMVERDAECLELRLVPSGADAQDQAPAADLVDGGGHLGQHGGIAEGDGHHQGSQLDTPGVRRQRGEHGPGLVDPRGRLGGESEEQVVVDPDRVESAGLCRPRDRAQIRVGRRSSGDLPLADGHHHADLHRRMVANVQQVPKLPTPHGRRSL